MATTVSTFVSVLRHEGLRAVFDRILDRRDGQKHLRRLVSATVPTTKLQGNNPAPVVNLSPIPPFPRRGGAQLQMLDRLEGEADHRTVAHLYPIRETWHLEHHTQEHRELKGIDTSSTDSAADLASIRRAVATATRIAETEIVHIENLFGLPLALVPILRNDGYRVILSVHDFSLFCRRPHLISEPGGLFCNFETDVQRCTDCLAADWHIEADMQQTHRSAGEAALRSAEMVVFPSASHRDRHFALFPGALQIERTSVIHPATGVTPPEGFQSRRQPHLAVIGGLKHHKGGALASEVLELIRQTAPGLKCTIFGDVEPEFLESLRHLSKVRIRGYYRAGRLPALLDAAGATIALFPSIAAESYGLVVDECLHAGVPVIAFDTGEVGHRLRRLQSGIVVDRAEGPSGLAAAVITAIENNLTVPEGTTATLPTPAKAAQQYLNLYEVLSPSPSS